MRMCRDDEDHQGEAAAEHVAEHRRDAVDGEILGLPPVLDRSRRVEHVEVRTDRCAEDADGEVPVPRGIVRRPGRQKPGTHRCPSRVQRRGADREHDRDESEHRGAVLDDAECPTPEQHPGEKRDGERPKLEPDAGRHLERERDSTDLRRQDEEADHEPDDEWGEEESNPEPLAQLVGERPVAHRGEPSARLHQDHQRDTSKQHSPAELKAELGAPLRRGRERPYLEEAADPGDDA